jgi:DNA-binding transcriptional LysR family regulator
LSRSVAELERSCGLRLFDRGRSGVALTPAGSDLLTDARQILGQVSAVEQNLLLQSRGETGRVAFGVGPVASSYLMAKLLAECLARWPLLTITVSIDTTSALIEKVLDGRLDFCICATNTLDPNPALAVEQIGMLRLGYFVRAGHPLAHAARLTWNDLALFPRAAGTAQRSFGPSFRGVFGPLGPTVECDDYEVFRQIITETDTIWLTSDRVLEQELAKGLVKEIRPGPDSTLANAELALVRLAERSSSPAMLHVTKAVSVIADPARIR